MSSALPPSHAVGPKVPGAAPRLSVVMPYYRNEATLPRVLASLAAQTRPPCEIIVVDDGSEVAAKACLAAAPRTSLPCPLRLLHSPRAGQSGATNRGIAAACGELILLTCADIIAHPRLVDCHWQTHVTARDEVAVVGYLPYAEEVEMTPFMQYLVESDTQFSFANIADPNRLSPLFCYAPNVSAQGASLRAIGGFDERFVYGYQDTDLGKRLAAHGARFVFCEAAIGYHVHPNSLRAFLRRQAHVGDATLLWLEKYQEPQELEKMRLVVAQYRPYVDKIAAVVDDIERLETLLRRRPASLRAVKARLYRLYQLVTNAAIVEGMLRQPTRLAKLMGPLSQTVEAAASPSA